jgi:outer membrane lipoprotein SlyB
MYNKILLHTLVTLPGVACYTCAVSTCAYGALLATKNVIKNDNSIVHRIGSGVVGGFFIASAAVLLNI